MTQRALQLEPATAVDRYRGPAHNRVVHQSGERFGCLTVQRLSERRGRQSFWVCLCDCGNAIEARGAKLRSGHTKSCGCAKIAALVKRTTRHGAAPAGRVTPEYRAWRNMISRCSSKRPRDHAAYAARGIVVCAEWLASFEAFLAHIGPRPSTAHEVDRYPNNDGNYEPGNVRWATRRQQVLNTRANRLVTYRDETKPVTVWSEELGLPVASVRRRLDLGWTVEAALTTPVERRPWRRSRP